ncbi:hypothetical protein DTO207G8_102 [Paecilomyces variotii]|nr:hypothetical protein DTO169C6_1676 [Paecilomyces variotii]KAJ9260952.1 hypothetical protein DTO207G8_102 [Paecilomyces variotii]KAJ9266913.1 hypothetical protein DTO195F2_848 [Paecilomyces variotii]KAJ9352688.1 hypothetical protein DTO027B9_5696 [Paecilomyces variotii]
MPIWKSITIRNAAVDESHERKYFAWFAKPTVKSDSGHQAFPVSFHTEDIPNDQQRTFQISTELFGFVGRYYGPQTPRLKLGVSIELLSSNPIKLGVMGGGGSQLRVALPAQPRQFGSPSIILNGQSASIRTFEITCDGSFAPTNRYVVGIARKIKQNNERLVAVAVLPCIRNTTYTITPVEEMIVSRNDEDRDIRGMVISPPTNGCVIQLNQVDGDAQVEESLGGFVLDGRLTQGGSVPSNENAEGSSQPQTKLDESGGVEERWDIGRIREWHTIFVIDNTNSMSLPAKRGGKLSRWDMVRGAMRYAAEVGAREDEEGVDVHFLLRDDQLKKMNVKSGDTILKVIDNVELRRSGGRTFLEPILTKILSRYTAEFAAYRRGARVEEPKPLDLIILTDGEANDKVETRKRLIKTAVKLDELDASARQVGIQFVQVGDDEKATEFLNRLGKDIKDKYERQMVGTMSYHDINEQSDQDTHQERFLEILLGAMTRELPEE